MLIGVIKTFSANNRNFFTDRLSDLLPDVLFSVAFYFASNHLEDDDCLMMSTNETFLFIFFLLLFDSFLFISTSVPFACFRFISRGLV